MNFKKKKKKKKKKNFCQIFIKKLPLEIDNQEMSWKISRDRLASSEEIGTRGDHVVNTVS